MLRHGYQMPIWKQLDQSMPRVGQNHIYIYGIFGREITKEVYGHIRCIYTVLDNPKYTITGMQLM